MNIAFWVNVFNRGFLSEWTWKPVVKRSGWPLKNNKRDKVWYLNWKWLCFGGQIDNEW